MFFCKIINSTHKTHMYCKLLNISIVLRTNYKVSTPESILCFIIKNKSNHSFVYNFKDTYPVLNVELIQQLYISPALAKAGNNVIQSVRTYVPTSVVAREISDTILDRNLKFGIMQENILL